MQPPMFEKSLGFLQRQVFFGSEDVSVRRSPPCAAIPVPWTSIASQLSPPRPLEDPSDETSKMELTGHLIVIHSSIPTEISAPSVHPKFMGPSAFFRGGIAALIAPEAPDPKMSQAACDETSCKGLVLPASSADVAIRLCGLACAAFSSL